MWLLANLLRKFIRNGRMRLFDSAGTLHEFGGYGPGPAVTLRLHGRGIEMWLFRNPELHAAEAYMDGKLTFEDGSNVRDFLMLFSINREGLAGQASQKLVRKIWRSFRRWHQNNPIAAAARKARHHYDVSAEVYQLFLDPDLHYSCAYFRDPEHDTLEVAQRNKLIHATSKLRLKPGMTIAEIGSGWGAFAIHLARENGARVVALNVSPEQLRVARRRAAEAGVADRVEFRELDYRALEGKFDRVVSIGMMEHVGVGHYDEYFGKIRDLLTDDGCAFVHCIGRNNPPSATGAFIQKYIFPGAYAPAMSEVFASLERCDLWTADLEILRLHYTYTLRHWSERFARNRAQIAQIYDERFCRMWEFYLAAVELSFFNGSLMVFQVLLSKARDAVPITRDFMFDAERAALGRVAGAA